MVLEKPSPTEVWQAIEIYLRLAYDGPPPPGVRSRIERLRSAPAEAFFDEDAFERDSGAEPARYSLRLGNRLYAHMKLVIDRAPGGEGFLFRADTHDSHCCPEPASAEHPAFCELMARNQAIARSIEAAWEKERLPTFKSYLRESIARRREA